MHIWAKTIKMSKATVDLKINTGFGHAESSCSYLIKTVYGQYRSKVIKYLMETSLLKNTSHFNQSSASNHQLLLTKYNSIEIN